MKKTINELNLHAKMIEIAYFLRVREIFKNNEKDPGLGPDWKILATSMEDPKIAEYGYEAVAFINESTKQVVIAHAGTNDYYDFLDNYKISLEDVPYKFHQVQDFNNHILAKLREKVGEEASRQYSFCTTGHSLGGILSDLCLLHLEYSKVETLESVSFDSPGSAKIMENAAFMLVNDKNNKNILLENISSKCKVINGMPNFINSVNMHIGNNIYMAVPIIHEKSKCEKLKAIASCMLEHILPWTKIGALGNGAFVIAKNLYEHIKSHKLSNFTDEEFVLVPVKKWGSAADIAKLFAVIAHGYKLPVTELAYNKELYETLKGHAKGKEFVMYEEDKYIKDEILFGKKDLIYAFASNPEMDLSGFVENIDSHI